MWDAYNEALEALERLEKKAFIPMPAGQPMPPEQPPMDPSMMGGGMPMDPAMMGGGAPMDPSMMGGGMPMDPAMMGGGGGMPPPPPVDPAAEQAAVYDMIVQAVRQVMSEMGIEPETKKEEKPKSKSESGEGKGSRLDRLEKMVEAIAGQLGVAPEASEASAAPGLSSGSGMPAEGGGAMPIMGPLDPMAGAGMSDAASMAGMPMPAPTMMPKAGGFRPLDDMNWARNMSSALKKIRMSM